jgi:FkbM family methyltransferase
MRYIQLVKHLSNWWLHFAVKLGLTKKDPLIFRTRNDIIIEVPQRLMHEFKEIFMEQSYTQGLAITVPDRPIIIDIGANVGFFSLFAAFRFAGAKIFCYEPIASNFKQLNRNKRLNENIQMSCFQKAVYGYSGEVAISYDPTDDFTTSASIFNRADMRESTVQVPCVTLQDIFNEHQLEHIDLLKMDCEGSEYEILYNCPVNYLHRVDQMAMEVHGGTGANQNIASLSDYLNSVDYNTHQYEDHMLWAWRRSLANET